MKKYKLLAEIIFVFAIIFAFLAAIFSSSYDSSKNNGLEYKFNEGWFIENDIGELVPFDDFGSEINSERIALVHKHDEAINKIDAIGFYNYYSAVEVYVGDNLIYSYGSLDDINNGVLLGNFYSMVDIHGHHMEPDNLKIVFLNNRSQTIYGFRAGSGAALEMAMIREYIPSLITPVLTLLFFIVTLILWLKKETRDLISKKHIWLLVFSAVISLWELADTQLFMDMGFNAGAVCLLSFETFMVLPIPLLMLTFHSCKNLRTYDIVMCGVSLLNYIVLNILNFSGVCNFLNSLLSTFVITVISMFLCFIQITYEYDQKGNRETLMAFIGYLAFVICAVVQYLNFFANPTESNSQMLQGGVLLFLMFQISDVFIAINDRIHLVTRKLEKQTEFLEKTFKTLVPDDMNRLNLNNKNEVANLGSTRNLTVLESDIRGFSELIPNMSADEAIDMLNHYLGVMTNIIRMHDGIVLEFVGDAVIAIFDEKNAGMNHAEKAVFSAVEMQLCMDDIRAWNKSKNYPEFEMGIGVTTGQAYVGYIGSESRMEYDAIGSTINLVSRIEGYSTGGQILISKQCKDNISKNLIILDSFTIMPKGYSENVEVFLIGGFGEPYNLKCSDSTEVPVAFKEPIPITYNTILHKQCQEPDIPGLITEASKNSATLVTENNLKLFDNIRINSDGHIYCKVVSKSKKGYLVRFTSSSGNLNLLKTNVQQSEANSQ